MLVLLDLMSLLVPANLNQRWWCLGYSVERESEQRLLLNEHEKTKRLEEGFRVSWKKKGQWTFLWVSVLWQNCISKLYNLAWEPFFTIHRNHAFKLYEPFFCLPNCFNVPISLLFMSALSKSKFLTCSSNDGKAFENRPPSSTLRYKDIEYL